MSPTVALAGGGPVPSSRPRLKFAFANALWEQVTPGSHPHSATPLPSDMPPLTPSHQPPARIHTQRPCEVGGCVGREWGHWSARCWVSHLHLGCAHSSRHGGR